MAKYFLEIASIGDKYKKDISRAIKIANNLQNEFEFQLLDSSKQKFFQTLSFEKAEINQLFIDINKIKNNLDGYYPNFLLITDGYLYDLKKDLTNLFGDYDAEKKISVLTTCFVGTVIIPEEKMEAYFLYYFARFALNFLQPNLQNHIESNSCVMDLKQKKTDLKNSMRTKALCNDCRRQLIDTEHNLSPSQFDALNIIFEQCGEILKEDMTKIHLPKVFIGSSTEGLQIARKIQVELQYDAICEIWNQGTYQLGNSYIEDLENAMTKFDFGIFVFTPDDEITIRGEKKYITRDNVIFELGMFLGKLSRKKAFIFHSRQSNLHMLTDLHGVSKATFDSSLDNLSVAISPGCEEIRTAIKNYA